MTDRYVAVIGQSGAQYLHDDNGSGATGSPAPQSAWLTVGVAQAGKLLDPADTFNAVYGAGQSTVGGTGMVFPTSLMTLGGDNFYGAAASDCFVRPSRRGLPTWDDWTAWPVTTKGGYITTYLGARAAGVKSGMAALVVHHVEYDAQAYTVQTWANNDPEIWARGLWRAALSWRTSLGRTEADLPVFIGPIFPYSPGTDTGYEILTRAREIACSDAARNIHLLGGSLMDLDYDREAGVDGDYGSHPDTADQIVISRRLPMAIDTKMKALGLIPGARYSGLGMNIVWVKWVDSTTLHVFVDHDGGNDITLPSDPLAGWDVRRSGVAVTVSAVTKVNKRTLALTLASACPVPDVVRVRYLRGRTRTRRGGAFYDNRSVAYPGSLPATITGADRVEDVLSRTPFGGVVARTADPPARLMLPLTA